VKDERLLIPKHEVLAKELREVEKDKEKDKVDHPPSGTKDISDAVAGVVYMLHRKEARYGGRPARGATAGATASEETGEPLRKMHLRGGEARRASERPVVRARVV